ncbi:alkaline phosphatase family protein [Carboxylicivirga mesophila]|uniref:Alkaline phosphatase family protein n=1 Tax=Carboxylicivirga mesophila TaxID=1166478 RepID=A0ABS5KCC1_9BACT|nr:alkaline phosphatase family protein [Carboxylicivirga mesophila]MBS2212685.1 alkaline phosphatase family protein [Carboxylicivirga mesophila]
MNGKLLYVLSLLITLSWYNAYAGNKKVLIIGIDGCRPDALQKANTPNIDKLWKEGAYTFSAQTDPISSSGICWTGMLTGVWHEKHKVVTNEYKQPNIEEYPHFFRRLKEHDSMASTYSVVNWKPIHKILQSGDSDLEISRLFDGAVARAAKRMVKRNDADAIFIQLDEVDHSGHVNGFSPDSIKYLKTIEKADKHVGKIIKALKQRKHYDTEDWLVIITTDHGGSGYEHGKNIMEHTTIFYIANGNSVNEGHIEADVYVVDVAVTALHHLGVKIKEDWNLDGKVTGIK